MLDTAQTNNTIPVTMTNLLQRVIKLEGIIDKLLANNAYEDKRKDFIKLMSPALLERIFTLENVSNYIEDYLYLSHGDLKRPTRKTKIRAARQLAMYMLWDKNKPLSLKQIGAYFGGRDHSTVIHSRLAVLNLFDTDAQQAKFYEDLTIKMAQDYIEEQKK